MKVKPPIIRSFLLKWRSGELTDRESELLIKGVSRDLLRVFELMKNEVDFYDFMLQHGAVALDTVEWLLGITESVECRALLLNYKASSAN